MMRETFWKLINAAIIFITTENVFFVIFLFYIFTYVFLSWYPRKLQSFDTFLVWCASWSQMHILYFLILSLQYVNVLLLFSLVLLRCGWQLFTFFILDFFCIHDSQLLGCSDGFQFFRPYFPCNIYCNCKVFC